MKTVIKVEELSKQYRLGQVGTGTLHHDVNRWWHAVRGKEDPYKKIGDVNDRTAKGNSDYVWALKDVNFEVKQGEVLGIIGKNGAGKSTLLKILSRTTVPTTGRVKIRGRIASLLEVGTGFHPELSGRDNIYLNGAILGMTKAEIKRNFDEIVDFAGVERYIDTPVKRYSSGMYVRLAFAVAAHLEPEILIVDEVLAVGDIEFQKKALGKMQDVSNTKGRTVLFVSHNLASLRSLCNRAILMSNGELINNGPANLIIDQYERTFVKSMTTNWVNKYDQENPIYLKSVKVLNTQKVEEDSFLTTEDVLIEMTLQVKEYFNYIKVGFDLIKNNNVVFRSLQVDSNSFTEFDNGTFRFCCTIPKNLLNEGEYFLQPHLSIHCVENLLSTNESVVCFRVKHNTSVSEFHAALTEHNHPGLVFPNLKWELQHV